MEEKLNLEWVSDVIGNEYKEWQKGDMIKIHSQTGTGKTTFILNTLVDNLKPFEKMIYICNRILLKRQIKIDLLKKFNKEIVYNGEEIDLEWLDNLKTINNITVSSYHAVAEGALENIYSKVNNSLDSYAYIICDECHWFLSDNFYEKNYLAFNELVNKYYKNSIKIFISGTMHEVNKALDRRFKKGMKKEHLNRKIYNYDTNIDYSYLNIKYFKSLKKDVYKLIKNDTSDGKWLIFISSKKQGEDLNKNLNDIGIETEFIHSNSKKSKEKENILRTNSFSSKVLITTKCLDNGVNIRDSEIKNLVIISYDKVTFLQEVGRKRVDIKNPEKVNLYIPMLDTKTFKYLLQIQEKKFKQIDVFENNINEFKRLYNNNSAYSHDLFYLDNQNEYKKNQLGQARLIRDRKFYKEILSKIVEDKFAFIKEQLSWLHLEDTFNENNLIKDIPNPENTEELRVFLESAYKNDERFSKEYFLESVNCIIDKDVIIQKMLNELKGRHNSRSSGMKTYNRLFDKLGINYVVGSKPDKKTINGKRKNITYWLVAGVKD